jgi:MFS family permease
MSLFPMAVITLFWKHQLGMSMTEIMVLQAIFGLVVAVFEFPSGYLADRIGYRRSLIAASALAVAGWLTYSAAVDFWTAAAAEILLGLGLSLISGADSALLYESLVDTGREKDFARWFGRARFFGQSAEGTTALVAGLLFTAWPRLPFVMQIVVWTLNLLVALMLVEPPRHRPPPERHLARVRAIIAHSARGNPRLRAVILLTTALGLSSFIPVWVIQLYATGAGVPVAWLGPIWATANYCVALSSLLSARLGQILGLMPTLGFCVLLVLAGYLGLGLSQALFGFAFYYCLTAMRGINGPILHHEEQRLVPSSDRASFISLRSLLFRGTFFLVGPLVGAAIDRHGQHPVLLTAGPNLFAAAAAGWLLLWRAPAPPYPGTPIPARLER